MLKSEPNCPGCDRGWPGRGGDRSVARARRGGLQRLHDAPSIISQLRVPEGAAMVGGSDNQTRARAEACDHLLFSTKITNHEHRVVVD